MKLAAVLLVPLLAMAQEAQVAGRIRDPAGALVPAASVVATNLATGMRYPVETGDSGAYVVSARPGIYKIAVRKNGFRTAVCMNVVLVAGAATRADFALTVGSVEEVVYVTSDRLSLDSGSSESGTAIGSDLAGKLPLNGRGVLTLLEAAPGVVVTPAGTGDAGQFSVNGQRADANYITVDGVSVNAGAVLTLNAANRTNIALSATSRQSLGGALPVYSAIGSLHGVVSMEELDEFRLHASATPAAFGRMPGGVAGITTRAGSNELHASAAARLRGGRFDANDWFWNRDRTAREDSSLRDFAASAGGPILRNRTFFFAAMEDLRLHRDSPWSVWVPDAAARATAGPFASALLELLPLPNAAGRYQERLRNQAAVQAFSARLDQQVATRWRLFARISHAPSSQTTRDQAMLSNPSIEVSSDNATLGIDTTLGPRTQNMLRANWLRTRERASQFAPSGNAALLSRYVPPLVDFGQASLSVQVAGVTDDVGWLNSGDRSTARQRQWNVVDTLSLARGRHLLDAGFDFRRMAPQLSSTPYELETSFASLAALERGDLADVWLSAHLPVSFLLHNWSAYVQDAWKPIPRLTVNLGLRWDSNPPPVSTAGGVVFVAKSAIASQDANAPSSTDASRLWTTGYSHFAPRAGMALQLPGGVVLRAGAGLYYGLGFGSALTGSVTGAVRSFQSFGSDAKLTLHSDWAAIRDAAAPARSTTWVSFVPGFQSPRTANWNATLERALGPHATASLGYAGSRGSRLLLTALPAVVDALIYSVTTNEGRSSYHALQAQVRTRQAGGWQLLAGFNWAHSIDNVSKVGITSYHFAGFDPANDRASSDFDVRHSLFAGFVAQPRWARGWALDGILRARSGFPVDPSFYLFDSTNQPVRPDWTGTQKAWISDDDAPGGRRLNPAAFAAPPGSSSSLIGTVAPRQGTLGRNALAGFGMVQLDLALGRAFRLSERSSVETRLEAYNATNHPNFGNPTGSLSAPGGVEAQCMLNRYLGTGGPQNGLTPSLQIGGPRSLQLSLRFRF